MNIAIVEDEQVMFDIIQQTLGPNHRYTRYCSLEELDNMEWQVDLILLDRYLGDDDAWQWFQDNAQEKCRNIPPILLVSGQAGMENSQKSAQALQANIVSKIPTGDFPSRLMKTVRKLDKKRGKVQDIRSKLYKYYERVYTGDNPAVIGVCDAMIKVQQKIHSYKSKDIPVLITGPTGSGKELVAQELHNAGERSGKLVPIVTNILPKDLIGSELFGYEEGHATDMKEGFEGLIAQAENGTLFLDEIADMPPGVQVQLLRFLQNKMITPIGGEAREIETKIVAATHKNLLDEIDAGRFREDFYYRLACAVIEVPPLEKRSQQDLDLLIEHFMRANEEKNSPKYRLSKQAYDLLSNYHWPGNIRELNFVIDSAVLDSDDGYIDAEQLKHRLSNASSDKHLHVNALLKKIVASQESDSTKEKIQKLQDQLEIYYLRKLYQNCGRNWAELCRIYGVADKETFTKPSKMNVRNKKIYQQVTGKY